ncbi:MAG: DUF4288 domain-containing protein [Hyphomonadaceae bacterium]|nr:DUF4288 domain-containing protein [Aquidulcibacter sp.]
MTWYCANLLFVIKAIDEEQEVFPVEEEVYLVEAPDDETAWRKAERIGREEVEFNGTDELNSKLATREFIGLRKLRSIYNPVWMKEFEWMKEFDKDPPVDGSELTRSYFEVRGLSDLEELKQGRPVMVLYKDGAT